MINSHIWLLISRLLPPPLLASSRYLPAGQVVVAASTHAVFSLLGALPAGHDWGWALPSQTLPSGHASH